jgi:Flp pilus assembly protein TadD
VVVRLTLAAAVSLLASSVLACASVPLPDRSWRPALEADLAARGLDSADLTVPFELDAAGHAWLAAEQLASQPAGDPLQHLLARMVADDGLGIRYERSFTGTAAEVMERRRANCLGFVNLFVALAREMGLPAFFVAVDDRPIFDREGDLVLISDHVSAGIGSGGDLRLLDFQEGENPEFKQIHAVSDLEAMAKYYSNRGAEMVREGKAREARQWLETAVRIAPSLAASWVNLGVARRRTGDLAGAERAYRTALEADPRTLSAYQNLAALLRLRGEEEEAIRLLASTERAGNRNPYSYLSLGDWNRESGRLEEARRCYRRALMLDGLKAEPYAAMGELELAGGKPDRARRWLRKAQKLDPADERAAELELRLAERQAS